MNLQNQNNTTPLINKMDEEILVIKTTSLFPEGSPQGLHTITFETIIDLIETKKEFHPRALMEQDINYKQIIPYLVFTHQDRYFLMQRSDKASETRLQSHYSLGIGGHVRREDIMGNNLFDWAKREFNEEITYNGTIEVEPIGIVNDDSIEVGKYHVGLVMLLHGDSSDIAIRSELKSGTLIPLEECMHYNKHLETWSQMILAFLLDRKYGKIGTGCNCNHD